MSETYQVRHNKLGVFQGIHMDMVLWHPYSNAPQFGYFEFTSENTAKDVVDFFVQKNFLNKKDLIIEKFNKEESDGLLLHGIPEECMIQC